MSRLIICCLGLAGFSVILTEMINSYHLFDFKMPLYLVAGPAILLFLFGDLGVKRLKARIESVEGGADVQQRILTGYNLLIGMILLAFAVSIPFLWWGVIKKLTDMAGQGKYF